MANGGELGTKWREDRRDQEGYGLLRRGLEGVGYSRADCSAEASWVAATTAIPAMASASTTAAAPAPPLGLGVGVLVFLTLLVRTPLQVLDLRLLQGRAWAAALLVVSHREKGDAAVDALPRGRHRPLGELAGAAAVVGERGGATEEGGPKRLLASGGLLERAATRGLVPDGDRREKGALELRTLLHRALVLLGGAAPALLVLLCWVASPRRGGRV